MKRLSDLVLDIEGGARAAHAFICEGVKGSARDSFITSLAAGLECTHPQRHERPCGRCPECRQTKAGTSLDVIRMSKSEGSGKSARSLYRTSDAAEFIERLSMDPYGRHLVGIIDDADILSEIIQNKLLKTLEEPGPDTVILLAVSNRDNLLDTVRSRCSDIRISEYEGYESAGEDPEGSSVSEAGSIADMMLSGSRFYEFRNAIDKHIKTREDALVMLDAAEDRLRAELLEGPVEQAGKAALRIERIAEARMDIRRDMSYQRALRRLYIEIN